MSAFFDFKIVVAGAFAVGKSSLIRSISDQDVVGTEAPTSGAEASVKDTTTVGMEYGTLAAGGDGFSVELNLYGVPGQDRFSFMWDIVAIGMDGLFLLIDMDRPETWDETAKVARHFIGLSDIPVVVGINRADDHPGAVEEIESAVPIAGAQYLLCNPTEKDGARQAIVELLFSILENMPEDDDEGDHEREQRPTEVGAAHK